MIIAIAVLLVVGTLGTVAVATAVQTNAGTRHDAAYKNAAEAAEAGLQIALYRMNMANPTAANCVGDSAGSPGTSGWCQSSTYSLGNGSTYQYWTTPVMAANDTCAGLQITSSDVNQRCITAVGVSGGQVARSQIRAGAFTAAPLFPDAGAIGLSKVTMTGNAAITGAAASNGTITQTGQANSQGLILGPSGSYSSSGNASGGTLYRLSSPIVLDPVNPGTSNQSSITACPDRQNAGYPSCNDDYRISDGVSNPVVVPYDKSSGINWNASTRSLSLSGNASLTLGGGLYNFCSVSLSGNATITVAANVQAEVFIDSPDDPGSGCPSGSGSLSMSGNGTWVNLAQNPLSLQLYVYGLNNGSSSLSYSGNANIYGVVYAPQSQVAVTGNGKVIGGLAGKTVTITGNGFNWDTRVKSLEATTDGIYFRTAWAQCTPSYATSSPGAGCG